MQPARGTQNGCFQYCSLTSIVRRARAVERTDRGTHILHDPRAAARTHPARAQRSAFSYAAIAAIVALWIHADRNSKDVTLRDIAGAFTLMGCTAAILSEPDQVAHLFEQLFEGRSDTPR